jgi:hypothetical protein
VQTLGMAETSLPGVATGRLACPPSAAAEPEAVSAPEAPSSAAPPHHGGGFALVPLRCRLALEDPTVALRERSAELRTGTHLFPGEMTGAWHPVTAGASPTALIAGRLRTRVAFVARLARAWPRRPRRLTGAPRRANERPLAKAGGRFVCYHLAVKKTGQRWALGGGRVSS